MRAIFSVNALKLPFLTRLPTTCRVAHASDASSTFEQLAADGSRKNYFLRASAIFSARQFFFLAASLRFAAYASSLFLAPDFVRIKKNAPQSRAQNTTKARISSQAQPADAKPPQTDTQTNQQATNPPASQPTTPTETATQRTTKPESPTATRPPATSADRHGGEPRQETATHAKPPQNPPKTARPARQTTDRHRQNTTDRRPPRKKREAPQAPKARQQSNNSRQTQQTPPKRRRNTSPHTTKPPHGATQNRRRRIGHDAAREHKRLLEPLFVRSTRRVSGCGDGLCITLAAVGVQW